MLSIIISYIILLLNWNLSLSRKKSADRKKEENINIIYRFNRLKNFLNVEKPMAFQKIFPFCSAQTLALTTNTEDASNDEFSASFGLSSLKGNSLPASFAPKASQKFIHLRSSGVLK